MKPIFCALALCATSYATLAPALAQKAAKPTKSAILELGDLATFGQRPPTPTLTKDGLTITAIARPVDHVAEMLDVHLWQFKIEPPKPTADGLLLNYSLQLRRPGQEPLELSSGGTSFAIYQRPRTVEFTFGLKPEGPKSLHKSDSWELYTAKQIWNLPDAAGGSGSRGGCKNPLKELAFTASSLSPTPNIGADGTVVLMDYKADGSKEYDTKIVLVFTTQTLGQPSQG